MTAPAASPPPRRRRGRAGSGTALFGAFASTLALLRGLLFALVALYLGSGITRVAPHEDALIYRFGRLLPTVHAPGLLFALPAPIDRVVKISTRTQHELFLIGWSPDESSPTLATAATNVPAPAPLNPATLAVLGAPLNSAAPAPFAPTGRGLHPVYEGYTLTGDANLVQARFTARYRITDPLAFAAATEEATATPLIDAALYAAATRVLATLKIDAALGSGLEAFRTRVLTLAQQRLDALRLGVQLVAFEVNALTPPQATVAAFAAVTSAQVEARTAVEEARTYRAQNLPRAQGDAYRLRQQADADARQLAARAAGEARSFTALLAEHRHAPAVVATRLRAETLEQILPRAKNRTLVPAASGPLNLFLRDSK